jgi:ubiquinone/menaquinone biosynthesis C-methylase UbiE
MTKFDTNTEIFDKDYAKQAHHQKGFNEKIVNDLVSTIAHWFPDTAKRPLKILDLCCGHGEPTFNLLKQLEVNSIVVERMVGYDSSLQQIEKANKFAEKDSRLSFLVKNVEEMTDESEFDIIISLFGLHWMNDINDVANRIHRTLKPEGKLLFFVPLEKMDLFAIRKEFMAKNEWKEFFNDFAIYPFIKKEKGYTTFFDNYFEAEQVTRGKSTKLYSEQEFTTFLLSWLPEVRHLSAKQQSKDKCEEYVHQLIQSIPLNQRDKDVTRLINNETKVKFVEKYLLYQAIQKRPEIEFEKEHVAQQSVLNSRSLLQLGLFATVTIGALALKGHSSTSEAPHIGSSNFKI